MKNRTFLAVAIVALTSFAPLPAPAQLSTSMQDAIRDLSAGDMRGGGRRGQRGGGQWADGGQAYTTVERNAAGASEIIRYDTSTGRRSVQMAAEQLTPPQLTGPLQFTEFSASSDGRVYLFASNPRPTMIRKTAFDYWVLDTSSNTWHKLGGKSVSELLYAKLSPDATRVAYVRGNNLYVENIRGGKITQLTRDGSPMIINGTSDWVYEEEFGLRDAYEWSPDSQRIAYLQFDQSGVEEFALINYTDALYPVITRYPYPKAGQKNAAVRVGVVSAKGGSTRWMKVAGNPRDIYIPRLDWADSQNVIVQQLNRLQSTNNILLGDAKTGTVWEMFQDRDKAWVDVENFTWIEKGKGLLYVSEKNGWRHAYAIGEELIVSTPTFRATHRSADARLITKEPFDILAVSAVDQAGGWLYYIASPENATQRYLYRSRLDGTGGAERVTPTSMPGTHTYNISPDCKWAFHTYSRFDDPGASDLISLPDHKVVRVFQDNSELRTRASQALAGRTEMFQVDIGDGVKLDAWLIRPKTFDATKKYPLIVNVYGEPAGTTVNDSWGGNNRLLHAALADDGYLIASFDNRGTPSLKGREWRKIIYGSVGVLASKEQAAAVRALAAARPYVDLDRVGVFGWSGGGSMTLNLMFRSPELYKVGVAGAPVPDQALYDSIYQERYMGLPQDNAAGYKAGSPISFTDGLRGKLLIIHGSGDDNVHFQGTQRQLNRLIELNKQFEFMEYPNRRHGISGPHIETLRYTFFEEYLPAGGR